MKEQTNSYWEKRALSRTTSYHRNADKTVSTITKAYDKAIADINNELDKIFRKVAEDGKISPDAARELLNQPITSRELDALREQLSTIKDANIKRQLLNRLNAPAYRARMTRLQALKEQIYIESKKIADVEIQASTSGYIDVINDAYYKNLFDIQQGLGVGFDVTTMPSKTIEAILNNPWSGKHFSKRVWNNTDVLADKLNEVITAGFKSGASIRKMRLELEDMSMIGKHAANRLVRTEYTYMANAAEIESYKEAEIDQYMYIATLDLRTSKICQEHDRQVYFVKDAKPGKNMPPLHPYCRSTTRSYFGEETLKGIQRRARDPETGKTYLVPADMTYEQWHKEHVVNKYGKDQAEVMKKKIVNEASDRRQYEKYKSVLGKDASKSFAEFQELKYNRLEEWEDTKEFYKYKEKYPSSDKSFYQIGKELKALGIKKGVPLPPKPKQAVILPDSQSKDPHHIMKRMFERHITDDEVRMFMDKSKVMFVQWNGARQAFYGDNGVSVIIKNNDDWIFKTAWSKQDFDAESEKIMEVVNKYVSG